VLLAAHAPGSTMQMPAAHPFNPLPLLRLGAGLRQRRQRQPLHVAEPIFRHVWRGGADAGDAARLAGADAIAGSRERDLAERRGEGRTQGQYRTGDRARRVRRADARWSTTSCSGAYDALAMLRAYLEGDVLVPAPGHWEAVGPRCRASRPKT
jgi:hypothetical protein